MTQMERTLKQATFYRIASSCLIVTIFKFARGFVPYNLGFSAFVPVEMNLVPYLCVSGLAPDCRSDAPIE